MNKENETQTTFGFLSMADKQYIKPEESNSENENDDPEEQIKERNKTPGLSKHLSYHKKLVFELDTLPKKQKKKFTRSLAKYKFNMEVYVPHSMVISKKEYYGKNYLLNRLVNCESFIREKKNFVGPLSKETKKFGRQYEFVKKENEPHQKNYLEKIEKIYEKKGYEPNNISYQKSENIFAPSLLLDNKFGKNPQEDIVKYRTNENQKEYKKDKKLLTKFDNFLRSRGGGAIYDRRNIRNRSPKYSKTSLFSSNNGDGYFGLSQNYLDEMEIKNMNEDEYLKYSDSMKNEIKRLEEILNNVNNKDDEDNFFNDKKPLPKGKNINTDNKNGLNNKNKNVNKNSDKNNNIDKKDKKLLTKFDNFLRSRGGGAIYDRRNIRNRSPKYSKTSLFSSNNGDGYFGLSQNYLDEMEIKNMNEDEYLKYSDSMKNEIKRLEEILNNVNNKDDEDNFFNDKKPLPKGKNINTDNKNGLNNKNKNVNKNSDKNNNINNKENINGKSEKLIDFNSKVFLSSKGMKKNNSTKNSKNYISKFNNATFPKINKKSTEKQINSVSRNESKKYKISNFNISNKNISVPKTVKKSVKEEKLDDLYNKLYYFTDVNNFPHNEINNYLKTYTKLKIPNSDPNSGSNIHGLVETTQRIVKEKSFTNFAKLNNQCKMDIYPYNQRKMIDVDFVEGLDKRISNLHYEYTNNLLSNQKEEIQL